MRDAHIEITEKALVSQSHHNRISTGLISCIWDQARKERQLNEDDARKVLGADNEHEAIPDISSLHAPHVPHVTLQGEISEASLLTLLDVLPDALVLVDAAGRIAQVNSQVEALFGYTRSELDGLQLE